MKKEKVKTTKGHQRYISRMRLDGTPQDIMMKLGTFVASLDVIIHANFHLHLNNSSRASGGSQKRISL
jgi:hypothetical protein